MTPIPATRGALVSGPLLGVGVGLLAGGLFWPMAGSAGALSVAVAVGSVMTLALAWMLYRSDYGSRHGLVAALVLMFMSATLVAAAATAVVVMLGLPTLRWWALCGVALSAAGSFATGAWREHRALRAQGLQGAWATAQLDVHKLRVRASAALGPAHAGPGGAALWLGAAIVNLPLLVRSWGLADAQWLPVLLAVMVAAVVWAGLSLTGPMAGRALYLMDHERSIGKRFRHEDFEALQALRQGGQ